MAIDLVQGTLDMLIMKALAWDSMHGYGIVRWLQQTTDDALLVEEGSLYPALHRLEYRGWIIASWGASENNRRAKFYRLSATGRKQLAAETAQWRRFAAGVELVLAAD